jgi:uncharacterized protein YbjT (DUF2867 family)
MSGSCVTVQPAAPLHHDRVNRMRILLTGASGFIGSAIAARLTVLQHEVIAVTHQTRHPPLIVWKHVRRDVTTTSQAEWLELLSGVHAVVNCIGALQDAPGTSVEAVHHTGLSTLFQACAQAGVRRVIHFSAIGVDRARPSQFSASKFAGDSALMESGLDWIILRPSVVVGQAAFGGSALFRGAAALPIVPRLPQTAPLQIVQLDDVVDTVIFFLDPRSPSHRVVEVCGPQPLTFDEVVATYRGWFGWPPARSIEMPEALARLPYRIGDLVGWLGWRPPIRSNARLEITRGATGDPHPWMELTGIRPRTLVEALTAVPSSVQERWFAQLYFAKFLVFLTLVLFWVGTGVVSLGPGFDIGMEYMRAAGVERVAPIGIVAGAIADILIGVGIAFRRTCRIALYGALAISAFYAVAGTILLPSLWLDPLGPMLKIWPIMALVVVALAIRTDR